MSTTYAPAYLFVAGQGHLVPAETPAQALRWELLEGQDMALVSADELVAGSIWSTRLGCHRPLADGWREVIRHLLVGKS